MYAMLVSDVLSSVARRGFAEYEKHHVFSTFETNFCIGMENSPPPPWQFQI